MKKFGIFAVLILLFAGVCFPTITVSEYETNQDTYSPGSSGIVTLTVSNPDDYDVTGLSVTIFNPSEITPSSFTHISDISSGGTVAMSIPFKVKETAPAGIYLLTVRFSGFSENPNAERTQQSAVSIPITVLEEPILSVSMRDTTELSGLTNVTLVIDNDGGPARRAKMYISSMSSPHFPIAFYEKSKISLGDITDEVTTNVIIDSRNAEDGPIDIPLVLEYDDELGISHQDTTYLRTTVENELLDITFVQNTDVVTREETILSMDIINRNEEDLSDVRISLLNSSIRLKEGGEIKVGAIPGNNGKATMSAKVFCELPPGLNNVGASISWIEEGVRKEQEIEIPVTVLSDADVGVYLEAKPAPLTAGAEHTVSVLISNLGSYKISNVEVEFNSDAFTHMDISDTQYIGGLDDDDFSTVQFKVKMNYVPEGDYPAVLDITYRDQSGEWVTKTVTEEISIYSQQAEEFPNGYLAFAVLIVLAAIWFFFLRKKR